MSKLEKIEKVVVEGYKSVENGVVGAYKKVEDTVVGAYKKVEDGFVEKHLVKDGETVEEAKERIAAETSNRSNGHSSYNHEEAMKSQREMIEKSIEASKNAGKR